jgi:hypothetical protein
MHKYVVATWLLGEAQKFAVWYLHGQTSMKATIPGTPGRRIRLKVLAITTTATDDEERERERDFHWPNLERMVLQIHIFGHLKSVIKTECENFENENSNFFMLWRFKKNWSTLFYYSLWQDT